MVDTDILVVSADQDLDMAMADQDLVMAMADQGLDMVMVFLLQRGWPRGPYYLQAMGMAILIMVGMAILIIPIQFIKSNQKEGLVNLNRALLFI